MIHGRRSKPIVMGMAVLGLIQIGPGLIKIGPRICK